MSIKVIEPKPKKISKDSLSNRKTTVGLALAEDKITSLTVVAHGYPLSYQTSREIASEIPYTIRADKDKVRLQKGEEQLFEGSSLELVAPPSAALSPEQGLSLSPIIAGRNFHWKKEITARYPGNFRFIAKDGNLVGVNILPFEDYLACVVVSEMSASTPPEFIKAQVIAARSWAVCFLGEKHPGEPFDLCNDDDCQRYQGVTFATEEALRAALDTAGEYLFLNGSVVPGYYSKSCGGQSSDPEPTFGFPVAGISSVPDGKSATSAEDIQQWVDISTENSKTLYCSGYGISQEQIQEILGKVDTEGEYFRWEHLLPKATLVKNLVEKAEVPDVSEIVSLLPTKRGPSGRIHTLEIRYRDSKGEEATFTATSQYAIRALLHDSFLYSSAFTFEERDENYLFKGAGWGHGVGLCQMGATFQALQGRGYKEILKVYFPEASLQKAY